MQKTTLYLIRHSIKYDILRKFMYFIRMFGYESYHKIFMRFNYDKRR